MLEWPNYRKYLNEHGYFYDSPGCYVRQTEAGEEEFIPHAFDPEARMPRWRALAEQGLAPGESAPAGNGTAVLERSYEPLEVAVEAACPFCGVVQQVHAWKRGVAQAGQTCRGCGAFVAAGCWEAT